MQKEWWVGEQGLIYSLWAETCNREAGTAGINPWSWAALIVGAAGEHGCNILCPLTLYRAGGAPVGGAIRADGFCLFPAMFLSIGPFLILAGLTGESRTQKGRGATLVAHIGDAQDTAAEIP